MIDLKEINKSDPLKRNVENGLDNMKGCTPFDPPSAYDKQSEEIPEYEKFNPVLKELVEEHKATEAILSAFEENLKKFKSNGYNLTPEINSAFSDFFRHYDEWLLVHNEKEEKSLFLVLNQKLIESGEHSTGENPHTAIDVMEDDHVKFIQLGTLSFNLFGMATRIMDPNSRNFVYDTAYDTARELTELIKLHIFRENHTLFPLANKLISTEEFEKIQITAKKYKLTKEANCKC